LKRCLAAAFLVLFLGACSSGADGTVHYRYEVGDGDHVDYRIAPHAVRVDVREGTRTTTTMIYRVKQDDLTTLLHDSREAVRYTRADLETLRRQMEEARRQMERARANMPPGARRAMDRHTPEAETKTPSDVELVDRTPTEWEGLSAVSARAVRDGREIATVVLLEESPVAVGSGHREALNAMYAFQRDLTGIGRSFRSRWGLPTRALSSADALRDQTFRLASFEGADGSMTLVEWGSKPTPDESFSVPEGYSLQSGVGTDRP